MFLLDTNIVSELRKVKSGKADKNVVSCCYVELHITALSRRFYMQVKRLKKISFDHHSNQYYYPQFDNLTYTLTK